jgi:hypothetical protein
VRAAASVGPAWCLPTPLLSAKPTTHSTAFKTAMQPWTAATAIAFGLAAAQATQLNVYNKCGDSIQLYDNSATETVASGGSTTRTLAAGFNGMFRNGVSSQATRTFLLSAFRHFCGPLTS